MRNTGSRRSWKSCWCGGSFFARRSKDRLRNAGDLIESRRSHAEFKFNNLDHLLHARYSWMQEFVRDKKIIVEVGAGAGFAPFYLKKKIILTDIVLNEWLDLVMDGTSVAIRDQSVDVVLISNALHHFAHPALFLKEASRILRGGGVVLINESYCSILMQLILRVTRHEGYSYDIDVFSPEGVANDPADPWSGNNAVSNLLFDSPERFEAEFPLLSISSDIPSEMLSFIASGGVTAKLPVPELPSWLLDVISRFDEFIVRGAPRLFALSRRTVLIKRGNAG